MSVDAWGGRGVSQCSNWPFEGGDAVKEHSPGHLVSGYFDE